MQLLLPAIAVAAATNMSLLRSYGFQLFAKRLNNRSVTR